MFKYKLFNGSLNDINKVKETILLNRGVDNVKKYLNTSDDDEFTYELLDNIDLGIELLNNAIKENKDIYIIVDCDVDGYTSASMIYNYIRNILNYTNIKYKIHTKKQHGLSYEIMEDINDINNSLIIIPDAGTNDVEECKKLKEQNNDILILDHHEKESDNPYALIINNQLCDYPNKSLCGAGIVYKFLQALDDELWENGADEFIDLVSLANIADVMDLTSIETKHLVYKGIKNIKHPLLKAFLEKQKYNIKNIEMPTVKEIAFYIVPLINAMIRVGTQEEKEMMFEAFVCNYNEYDYTPRKSKDNPNPTTIKEDIYTRVVRLCGNAKSKHDKMRDKGVNEIVEKFDDYNKDNKLFIANVTDILDNVMTGVVAIKIAEKYNRPCLLLRKDNIKSDDKNLIFSGSARNIDNCFIYNLKDELDSSNLFDKNVGHQNAFGVTINSKSIKNMILYYNEKFKDVDVNTKVYNIDFVLQNELPYKFVKEINSLNKVIPLKEPYIAIENVFIDYLGIEIWCKENKTSGKISKHFKFQIGDITFIKFNVDDNDPILNLDEFNTDYIKINCVGKANINEYGSTMTPQFIIEDYEIIERG